MPIEDELVAIRARLLRSSTDTPRQTLNGTCVYRGWVLEHNQADQQRAAWEIRRLITLSTLIAFNEAHAKPVVFARESALLLHSLPSLTPARRLIFRAQARSNPPKLRSVTHLGVQCERQVKQIWTKQRLSPVDVAGFKVDSLWETAIETALSAPPESALVTVNEILRRLSRFDRFDQPSSRAREAKVKDSLLVLLRKNGAAHNVRKAELVIRSADGACESVGESRLLFHLVHLFPEPVVTQVEQFVDGNQYFIDLALPSRRLAIEFDGMAKLGETRAAFETAKRELWDRQRDLERAGWRVVRVRWDDFADLPALRSRLLEAAA